MKKLSLIQICFLFLLCSGLAGWAATASGQQKVDEETLQKESERYMPLLKGEQWQKMSSNSKVSFIWGVAHVVLIEAVLMELVPELKRESFVTKVVEARAARTAAGTRLTINQAIDTIDQYYKDHSDKLEVPVMKVIWDLMIKPNIKTGIAGRPLK